MNYGNLNKTYSDNDDGIESDVEPLSINYGVSMDEGTYISTEHDRAVADLEDIEVRGRSRSNSEQLELVDEESRDSSSSGSYSDDGNSSYCMTEPMEYDDEDIRSQKHANRRFSLQNLRKKANRINIIYASVATIAVIIIISLSASFGSKPKKDLSKSKATGQSENDKSEFSPLDATVAPTSSSTISSTASGTSSGTFSGTSSGTWSGTMYGTQYWWQMPFKDEVVGQYNETNYPADFQTQEPTAAWWILPGQHQKPWWSAHTQEPTVWSSFTSTIPPFGDDAVDDQLLGEDDHFIGENEAQAWSQEHSTDVVEEEPAEEEQEDEEQAPQDQEVEQEEEQSQEQVEELQEEEETAEEESTTEGSDTDKPASEESVPEESNQEEPAPEEPTPDEPAPEEPESEETAPEEPAPEETAPEEPAPEEPAPEESDAKPEEEGSDETNSETEQEEQNEEDPVAIAVEQVKELMQGDQVQNQVQQEQQQQQEESLSPTGGQTYEKTTQPWWFGMTYEPTVWSWTSTWEPTSDAELDVEDEADVADEDEDSSTAEGRMSRFHGN